MQDTPRNPIEVRLAEVVGSDKLHQVVSMMLNKLPDNMTQEQRKLNIKSILYSNFQRQITRNVAWSVGLMGKELVLEFLDHVQYAIRELDETVTEQSEFYFDATVETALMTSEGS